MDTDWQTGELTKEKPSWVRPSLEGLPLRKNSPVCRRAVTKRAFFIEGKKGIMIR